MLPNYGYGNVGEGNIGLFNTGTLNFGINNLSPNFTPTDPREVCIFHVQGGGYYDKTKPERCYATEDDARRDGCRRSRR